MRQQQMQIQVETPPTNYWAELGMGLILAVATAWIGMAIRNRTK